MKVQAALLLLLSAAVAVHCYQTGAPAEACATIYPKGHMGSSLDCSSSPFQLSLSDFDETDGGEIRYVSGQKYSLTLSGSGGELFRGFLVQARTVTDGTPVGVFTDTGPDYKLSACVPAESAVTHTSNSLNFSVTFTWTAPSQGTEDVMFLFAVVVHNSGEVSEFYATCTTDVIHYSCIRDPCNEETCSSTNSTHYTCACQPGFTGVSCEQVMDPCLAYEPCDNQGTCETVSSTEYTCECQPGYTGENCSTVPALLCPSEQKVPVFSGSTILYDWDETEAGQSRSQECPDICPDFISQSPNGKVVRECIQVEDGSIQWKESNITGCGFGFTAIQICEASQLNDPLFLATVVNITSTSSALDSSALTACGNIVSMFTQLASEDIVIQEKYLEIIDNILAADRRNLLESQRESNTLTKVLQGLSSFQNLVVLDPGTGNVTFTLNNFAIVVMDSYSPYKRSPLTFSGSLGAAEEAICSGQQILEDQVLVSSESTADVTGSITLQNISSCKDGTVPRRISYSLFRTDALFLTPLATNGQYTIGSIILGVSADGSETCNVISITVNLEPVTETCGGMNIDDAEISYASFDAVSNEWIPERRYTEGSSSRFSQLGHFGLLFDLKSEESFSPITLAVISYIGAIFSIICLVLVVITYALSKKLRHSDHGQILINLSIALIYLYVVFIFAGLVTTVDALCGLVSALFQYFMLVFFGWTAAEALYLFRKLVTVHAASIRNYMLKAMLLIWFLPLLIVAVSVGAGHKYYINNYYCRSTEWPFWFGLILPFCVIYVFNWAIFVIIMIKLLGRNIPGKGKSRTFKQNLTIALGLSLLFGLGWGFGLSATSTDAKEVTFALQVIFSLFVGSQGLLIFIFHVLRSQEARKMWRPLFICCKGKQRHQIASCGSTPRKKTSFHRSATPNSGTQPASSILQSETTTRSTAAESNDLQVLSDFEGESSTTNTTVFENSNSMHSRGSVDSGNGASNVSPTQDENSRVTGGNDKNQTTAESDEKAHAIVGGLDEAEFEHV